MPQIPSLASNHFSQNIASGKVSWLCELRELGSTWLFHQSSQPGLAGGGHTHAHTHAEEKICRLATTKLKTHRLGWEFPHCQCH